MTPSNMPLWHINCFELKATEEQQAQEELSAICVKAGHKSPMKKAQSLFQEERIGEHSYLWRSQC